MWRTVWPTESFSVWCGEYFIREVEIYVCGCKKDLSILSILQSDKQQEATTWSAFRQNKNHAVNVALKGFNSQQKALKRRLFWKKKKLWFYFLHIIHNHIYGSLATNCRRILRFISWLTGIWRTIYHCRLSPQFCRRSNKHIEVITGFTTRG